MTAAEYYDRNVPFVLTAGGRVRHQERLQELGPLPFAEKPLTITSTLSLLSDLLIDEHYYHAILMAPRSTNICRGH